MPRQPARRSRKRAGLATRSATIRRRRATYGIVVVLAVLAIVMFAMVTSLPTAPAPSPSTPGGNVTVVRA
jgi:hypothetical protein